VSSGTGVIGSAASGVTSGSATTTPGATASPTPAPRGAWFIGDLHSHSATHSDDARRQLGDPIDVTVRVAEQVGLDFLAGTDHRTNAVLTDPNFSSQTIVTLAGMEWGGSMHAGAIGQSGPIQVSSTQSGAALVAEVDGIIASVHQQGGVFVLNHPMDPSKIWVVEPQAFDAVEVWNSQWSLEAYAKATQQDLDAKMRGEGLTQAGIAAPSAVVDAVAEQRGSYNLQALTMYESYLSSGRRLAAVGGGDRHMLFTQGHPTTHVFAADRTKAGILEGIRAARTYISRTPRGPLVDFRADDDGDGVFEAIIGDEVTPYSPVVFRAVVEGAPGGRVELVENGVVIRREAIAGNTHTLLLSHTPAAGAWYRVDVYEAIDPQVNAREGVWLRAAQAIGQRWSIALALLNMVPKRSIHTSYGTLLPTLILDDEVDKLLNASLKDPGYCRGAITSPIYTR
jgi:predicted metal-dependent phosphoesterase TrpH